jgi:transglutaminase-like putative cysteine protease
LKGVKIGWIRTVIEPVQVDQRTLIKGRSDTRLEMSRFGEKSLVQTRVESWETPRGEVQSFKLETDMGNSTVTAAGELRSGAMHVDVRSENSQSTRTFPWSPSQGGFFALEQSLRQQPMKPGEQRQLTSLMPGMPSFQFVNATLSARDWESVELLGGNDQRLLKIDMKMKASQQELDVVGWMDTDGELLKSSVPAMQQTIYRATESFARKPDSNRIDLGRDAIVKISTPLPHPERLTRLQLKVSLISSDPSKVFDAGHSQLVEPLDEQAARVTLWAIRPSGPTSGIEEPGPTSEDREANVWVDFQDPLIGEMSQTWVGSATEPWAKCVALEKGVHDWIDQKNFTQAFATAGTVVREREGDCTEHAVLLAAVCRAAGIPARVALGLVYSGRDGGFAFHMWTEAWVADRWIPLDATRGQGGIGATHLKLSDSSLASGSVEAAMMRIVPVIYQLSIEVLDHQPP